MLREVKKWETSEQAGFLAWVRSAEADSLVWGGSWQFFGWCSAPAPASEIHVPINP